PRDFPSRQHAPRRPEDRAHRHDHRPRRRAVGAFRDRRGLAVVHGHWRGDDRDRRPYGFAARRRGGGVVDGGCVNTGAVNEMFGVPEPTVGTSWNVFVSPLALSIATAGAASVAVAAV